MYMVHRGREMAPTRVQDSGSGLIIMETESINKNIMFAACC